jgi:hypothetical protein
VPHARERISTIMLLFQFGFRARPEKFFAEKESGPPDKRAGFLAVANQ